MQRASRHDLVRALAPRYGHVSKCEKSQILDQVCEVTGYTRKYALTLLKDPPPDDGHIKPNEHAAGPRRTAQPRSSWCGCAGW